MLSEGSIASLVVAASTGAAAIWAFKSRSAPQWLRALATPLATTALFALFFYMARISADMRLNAVFLVAAVRLSILLVSRLPAATKAKPYHSLFLMIVALVFTGWVALKWGTTELEWQAVYDFFPPQMVENQVAWFLPLILLKYCLPIVVVRLLLAEARSSGLLAPIPKRELAWFVGAKAVSLALIALGLAYVDATSMVYLEAVQQLGIFLTLAAGLI